MVKKVPKELKCHFHNFFERLCIDAFANPWGWVESTGD
jgi:hypothetical protein